MAIVNMPTYRQLFDYLCLASIVISGEHSRKPDEAYELIERMYPELPKIEFARQARPGWAAWGNEIGTAMTDTLLQLIVTPHEMPLP